MSAKAIALFPRNEFVESVLCLRRRLDRTGDGFRSPREREPNKRDSHPKREREHLRKSLEGSAPEDTGLFCV